MSYNWNSCTSTHQQPRATLCAITITQNFSMIPYLKESKTSFLLIWWSLPWLPMTNILPIILSWPSSIQHRSREKKCSHSIWILRKMLLQKFFLMILWYWRRLSSPVWAILIDFRMGHSMGHHAVHASTITRGLCLVGFHSTVGSNTYRGSQPIMDLASV